MIPGMISGNVTRLEELTRGDHVLQISAAHDGLEIEL